MCSYDEQDWTQLAHLSEAAGADALEVSRCFLSTMNISMSPNEFTMYFSS
jgi:hypothetical protein